MTEDEMVGWYHRLEGYELEQAPGVGQSGSKEPRSALESRRLSLGAHWVD